MLKKSCAALALFLLLLAPASADRVFVWTDGKGVKHFSNTGPSEGTDSFQQDEELPPASNPKGPTAQNRPETSSPDAAAEPEPTAEPQATETETDPDADYIETTRLDLVAFPMPQDDLVHREKSIVGDLQNELDQGRNRRQLIEREKNAWASPSRIWKPQRSINSVHRRTSSGRWAITSTGWKN